MGADNFTLMMGVNPSAEQVPEAPMTLTGVVPEISVTAKSLPSAAMVLHFMFLRNTNCISSGEQPGFVRLSIGVGSRGYTINETVSPIGIPRSQLSRIVFPSVPFLTVSV